MALSLSSEGQEIKVGSWVAYPDLLTVRRGKVVQVEKGELQVQYHNGNELTNNVDHAYCESCILL